MNPNKSFVRLASRISPIWFSLPVWVRYPVVIVLSVFLGWFCFAYIGHILHHYLEKYFLEGDSKLAFSIIGAFVFLYYFYNANIIMRYQIELNENANRDSKTGLYNSRYLSMQRKHITKMAMDDKLYVVAYFVDLNDFGQINKKHQHRTGDLAIKTVAKVITDVFRRQADIVIRYGGDEFLILCLFERQSDCEDRGAKLKAKMESIYLAIGEKVEPICISGSVGWAYDDDCQNNVINRVIDRADENMRKHKREMKQLPAQ